MDDVHIVQYDNFFLISRQNTIREDYEEEFSEKIDNMFSSKDSLSLNIEFNGELKRTTEKGYRQLKALTETIDPQLENKE